MTKRNSSISTLLKLSTACFLLSLAIILPVRADDTAVTEEKASDIAPVVVDPPQEQFTVALTIRYKDRIIFDNTVQVPDTTEFDYTDVNADGSIRSTDTTSTLAKTALTALLNADKTSDAFDISAEDLLYYSTYNPPSFYLKCINIAGEKLCNNWQYTIDNVYPDNISLSQYDLSSKPNSHIYIYFGNRYQIDTDREDYKTGTQANAVLSEYDFVHDQFNVATDPNYVLALVKTTGWSDKVISSGHIDANGQISLSTPITAGNYNVALEQNGPWGKYYINYHPITVEYPTKLTIRYKDNIILDQSFPLPTTTIFNYHIRKNEEVTTSTDKATALTLLLNADEKNDNFKITDIEYYPDMGETGSFMIKNIHLIYNGEELDSGNNWQYTTNGIYPAYGMDQEMLDATKTQHIYLYFGDRYQITTDKSEYGTGDNTIGTLNEYDYNADTYKASTNPAVFGLLDTTDNLLATSTIDLQGQATFSLTTTGTRKIGLENASDWGNYYWPASANFIVSEVKPEPLPSGCSGSCGSIPPTYNSLNTQTAINYLNTQQKSDGSFDSVLNTDWAAIAYGAYGQNIPEKEKLKNYLLTNPSIAGGLNQISDLTRRAMALMALGINPYSGTNTNYIQKIIDSYNDGQFGDKELYNDDIFALFPLLKSGYSATDEKIVNSVKFIISKQSTSGSWDGVDLTAAAIQSLRQIDGTTDAINKAKNYLTSAQQADGGFGNTYSTAWAIQAGAALGENESDWVKKANNYLYNKQIINTNGSVENNVWATAEAIPAALNKSWPQILNSFEPPKPPPPPIDWGGPPPDPISPTTTPTSTKWIEEIPTTTERIVLGEKITQETVTTPAPVKIETSTIKPVTNNVIIQQFNNETVAPPTNEEKKEKINQLINNLPLDTPTRRTAKKVAEITGGGALVVGLYLGLRLLKNVI